MNWVTRTPNPRLEIPAPTGRVPRVRVRVVRDRSFWVAGELVRAGAELEVDADVAAMLTLCEKVELI